LTLAGSAADDALRDPVDERRERLEINPEPTVE